MEKNTLAVEWVETGQLFANPANPRINDAAVPHVAASVRRFGWQQPIVAKRSGEVVAGHTRLKAARELGQDRVPVTWFDGTDLDATAFMIADNRSHSFSKWDEAPLAKLLQELRVEDSLEGVGFSSHDIDQLLADLEALQSPKELDDPGPEALPERPISRAGDMWTLGQHRLLCGDACDTDNYQRLLQGEAVDLVWVDAPYGVSYTGKTADALKIRNDDLNGAELEMFLRSAFTAACNACKPGAVWYAAAPAGPQFLHFAVVLTELGIWRQTLVWLKDSLVLGHSDFHYRHEALFTGWKPGAAHHAPRSRDIDSVWEVPRPKISAEHPTMKPVALVARAIETSSDRGEIVLDCFCGSATTILAAESTGRIARGIEIDPRYIDVGVKRWQQATGKAATLEGDGRTFDEIAKERGEVAATPA